MSTTGQVVGAVAGAIAFGVMGYMTGGLSFALIPAIMSGATVGMGIGGIIDPVDSHSNQGQPNIGDLEVTTASEGLVVSDFVGTTKLTGNMFWYGKSKSKKIKEKQESGKGGGGSKKVVVGYEYFLSWAVGLALGPVDELYTVFRNDEVVWSGNLLLSEATDGAQTITLDGVGSMTLYFGNNDHVANSVIGGVEGTDQNPSMKGLCWAFFNNCSLGSYNRAPTFRFVLRKTPTFAFNSNTVINTFDYNPAHAIWFILNTLCELPDTWLDSSSFSDFANSVNASDEKRGVSILFEHQEAISYINQILTHVGAAMIYQDDGTFGLKILRDDVLLANMPSIDDDNLLAPAAIESSNYLDTHNDIKVQYSQIYNVLGEELIPVGKLDPDDTLIGVEGDRPDHSKWRIVNMNTTKVTNPPLLNENGLEWSGQKTGEGSGEEWYRVYNRAWWTTDQIPCEIEFTMNLNSISATGSGEWCYVLKAGFTNARLDDDGGYIQAIVRSTGTQETLVLRKGSTEYSWGPTLTAAHWPLKVRLRRVHVSVDYFKVGIKYLDNIDGKWKNFAGTENDWTYSSNTGYSSWASTYFHMEWDLKSGSGVTGFTLDGGFSNFSVLEGDWSCWQKSDIDFASDDFSGIDNGDPPDTALWYTSGVGYISNEMYYMTTNYCQITNRMRLAGDFDVQIDLITDPPPGNNWGTALLQLQSEDEGLEGAHAKYRMIASYGQMHTGSPYIGEWSGQVYSGDGLEDQNYSPYRFSTTLSKLRCTRVGQVATCYYWGVPNAGWNVMATRSDWTLNDILLLFRTVSLNSHPVYLDNFIVNSADAIYNLESCALIEPTPAVVDIRQASVHAEDTGNKAVLSRTQHKDVRMMLYTNDDNARWSAARAVQMAAIPLRTLNIPVDREQATMKVGDVFKFSSAKYGITDAVFRLLQYSEGGIEDESIRIQAVEDANYLASIIVVDEADRGGGRRDETVTEVLGGHIVEAPYAYVEENLYLIPLAGRYTGQEVGVILYMSNDGGSSYTEVGTFESFSVYGTLQTALGLPATQIDDVSEIDVLFEFDTDAQDIETISRTSMIAGANAAVLIEGTTQEIITFQTITPHATIEGRYTLTNIYRGRYDTYPHAWAEDSVIYFIGVAPDLISVSGLYKGMTRHFKMVPYSGLKLGDISDADEIEHEIAGRAHTPYIPGNLRANDMTDQSGATGATYSSGIDLTWSPRIRGEPAGLGDPDSVVDAAPTWEGYFEIEAYISTVLVNTDTGIDDDEKSYNQSTIEGWNSGVLPNQILFKLTNYIVTDSTRYESEQIEITVTKV